MIDLLTLERYCNDLLAVDSFDDYCPNGLQIEVGERVVRMMAGVTACQALIEQARDWGADLLLVHHGFFWKGEPSPLRGMKGRRIATLIGAGINLLAYHLPLDAHRQLGNNAQLGLRLGFEDGTPAGAGMIWSAEPASPLSGEALGGRIAQALDREPLYIPGHSRPLRRIGWCSGAAQDALGQAAALGLDAYLSGEASERTTHEARELGIDYFAVGHHASERYGVDALGRHLTARFELEYRFCDVANPV